MEKFVKISATTYYRLRNALTQVNLSVPSSWKQDLEELADAVNERAKEKRMDFKKIDYHDLIKVAVEEKYNIVSTTTTEEAGELLKEVRKPEETSPTEFFFNGTGSSEDPAFFSCNKELSPESHARILDILREE